MEDHSGKCPICGQSKLREHSKEQLVVCFSESLRNQRGW